MNEHMAGDLSYKPPKLPPMFFVFIGFIIGFVIAVIAANKPLENAVARQKQADEIIAQNQAHAAEINALAGIKASCDGTGKKLKGIPQLYLGGEFYWCYKAK